MRALLALVLGCAVCGCAGESGAPAEPDGCSPGDAEQERYGTDCLCCHGDGFSAAGSVAKHGPRVQSILVVDANGKRWPLGVDPYDNFFLREELTPPLRASAFDADGREVRMNGAIDHGSCNACHREGTEPGPIAIPSR